MLQKQRKTANAWRFFTFAVPATLALLVATSSARAGQVITFDPLGTSGVGANLQTTSFQYLAGNILAINAGGPVAPGDIITVVYEAILGSINTTSTSPTEAALSGTTGNIFLSGVGTSDTNRQVVIEIKFNEQVQSFDLSNGTVVFENSAAILASGTNSVSLFIQNSKLGTSASINKGNGEGFGAGAPLGRVEILSGAVFVGAGAPYVSNFTSAPGSAIRLLNQHAGGSGTYAGISTITGAGNTSLTVNINPLTALQQTYFPGIAPSQLVLNFNTVSSAVPFRVVDPQTVMFDGSVPNIDTINGVTFNGSKVDLLIQSQANNDFSGVVPEDISGVATPEPATIASLGFGLIVGVGALLRRKRTV